MPQSQLVHDVCPGCQPQLAAINKTRATMDLPPLHEAVGWPVQVQNWRGILEPAGPWLPAEDSPVILTDGAVVAGNARQWIYHLLPTCGPKYHGCDPGCPKDQVAAQAEGRASIF